MPPRLLVDCARSNAAAFQISDQGRPLLRHVGRVELGLEDLRGNVELHVLEPDLRLVGDLAFGQLGQRLVIPKLKNANRLPTSTQPE